MALPPDRYYTPRRIRHRLRHRYCCPSDRPGQCNGQPFQERTETHGKRTRNERGPQRQRKRPFPDGGFERAVILDVDLEDGIATAGLTGAELTVVRLYCREWESFDTPKPVSQFSFREFAALLRSACNKIARALGALVPEETPRQDGPLIMIRVGDAAKLLNVSKPLVREYCEAGELRAVRERGEWRIDRTSVLGFWERRLGQVV